MEIQDKLQKVLVAMEDAKIPFETRCAIMAQLRELEALKALAIAQANAKQALKSAKQSIRRFEF